MADLVPAAATSPATPAQFDIGAVAPTESAPATEAAPPDMDAPAGQFSDRTGGPPDSTGRTPAQPAMAEPMWRWFRGLPGWAQAAGWIFGFWLLVPLLIWRAPWPRGWQWATTAGWAIVMLALVGGVASDSSDNPVATAPTTASGAGQPLALVESPTAGPTAAPTSAPTAEPTAAPTPPPTPEPTAPPTPPPPRGPTQREQAAAYSDKVAEIARRWSRGLDRVSSLASSPAVLSASWQRDWAALWSDMQDADRDARDLRPPACLADIHARILRVADLFDSAARDAVAGAAAIDGDRLGRASTAVQQAGTEASRITPMLVSVAAACTN